MADKLSQYRDMRDFEETPEPRGRVLKRSGRTFVVQKHDATRLHYDFRLELEGVLLSWAVTRGPSLDPADKRLAVRTEDHPLQYGSFEGVIPSGYGAGTVILWDRGVWRPDGDPHEALTKGSLKFTLEGERLKGSWALVRLKPRKGERSKRENWLLIKHRDKYANEAKPATEGWTTSVESGRDVEEMARAAPAGLARRAASRGRQAAAANSDPGLPTARPVFIAPQLATLRDAAPVGDDWVHEIKFDGYRIVAVVDKGGVRLFTRKGKDWSAKYPAVATALSHLKTASAVIDGELVALDDNGEMRFSRMQAAAEDPRIPLVYHVFDLMQQNGSDLRGLPLLQRKARLAALVGKGDGVVRFSDHIMGDGDQVAASACGMQLEGVISKRADASYVSGRGLSWIKSKCIGQDEFVIGGYRRSSKQGRPFSSLLLGEFDGSRLIYRGRVGTGFDGVAFRELAPKLRRLERRTPPFTDVPGEVRRDAVWVRPELVAQIAYLETTPDGLLRHPSYLGLREDKKAREVVKQPRLKAVSSTAPKKRTGAARAAVVRVKGRKITSPGKLLWPDAGLTKQDLAKYYDAFADRLMPFVKNRPLSIVRCPEGYGGDCFFQKHHNASTPDEIKTTKIREKDGGAADYLILRDKAGLVTVAQIGGLELHVWGAREDRLENPERLVFDLDPDEKLNFDRVKEAAIDVRGVLDSVGLTSFALLTGGKGIHVVAPIARTRSWDEVKEFCRSLARRIAASAPDGYVAEAAKAKRKGRIFIDWLRNQRGATAIAPFSPRRRAGAPVATPVSWAELSKIRRPDAFTIQNIGTRLASLRADPWDGFAAAGCQRLTQRAIEAVADQD